MGKAGRLLFLGLLFTLSACIFDLNSGKKSRSYSDPVEYDLTQIKERKKIIALTDYSSTSYFVYKGEPQGFEYELLKAYSDYIGVELEIKVVPDIDNIIEDLNTGNGDIIAANLTITKDRSEIIEFSKAHSLVRQMLVQRRSEKPDTAVVKSHLDLDGVKIHVREESSFHERLANIMAETGFNIEIETVSGETETEELIGKVSTGEIDYTVADENVALLNATYYSNIDVTVPLSLEQRIAWGLRKNSVMLKSSIDEWLELDETKKLHAELYKKYFRSGKEYKRKGRPTYLDKTNGIISEYDELIRKYSDSIGWDWRLVASIICQESNFDHSAESWAGAMGLMQMIPSTARKFGADSSATPEQNISAGTKYLKSLEDIWRPQIKDKDERLKFILASYNAGLGHVIDARNLCNKFNKSADKWDDNVAYFILQKSNPVFYTDEVVKCGYCRGREPYAYVKDVLNRYNQYKKEIQVNGLVKEPASGNPENLPNLDRAPSGDPVDLSKPGNG